MRLGMLLFFRERGRFELSNGLPAGKAAAALLFPVLAREVSRVRAAPRGCRGGALPCRPAFARVGAPPGAALDPAQRADLLGGW